MISGYDLYSIDRTTPTRSFEIPNGQRYVKMVKFAEKGDRIVGGSDHGCVYVFKISDSDPIQVLYHDRAESMIQTIAVSHFRKKKTFLQVQTSSRLSLHMKRTS